jgi:hypothetical protein
VLYIVRYVCMYVCMYVGNVFPYFQKKLLQFWADIQNTDRQNVDSQIEATKM